MKIEDIINDEESIQSDHSKDENYNSYEQDEQPIFDTTSMFKTDSTFDSHVAAFEWCVNKGLENRVFVVKFTIHVLDKYRPNRHIIVACECSGKPRPNLKSLKKEDGKIRETTTKRTNCPFRLRISEVGDYYMWDIKVLKGLHNHSPTLYASGHSLACKLSQKHIDATKRLTKAGARPRQIIASIKDDDPSNLSKMKTIYNIRQQLKHEMMEDRTVLQQFVKVLGDTGYKYELRKEVVTNVVSDVLFLHPDSLKLLHSFPYILIMDSTYNTNRYKVPLFEIVGITSTGNSFVAAYAFLSSEKVEIYTWVLDMLRKYMLKQLPTVILTDREMALISAVKTIFPSTDHMLCRWHIEKDVEGMVLKRTQNKDLATSFKFSWKRLINSHSVADYEKSWGEFREKYKFLPQLLKYLEDTWLTSYHSNIVSAWTDDYLHFGNYTTNRVESEHATLKSNIGTACGAYDYILERINMSVKLRVIEIKSKFEQSRCRFPKYAFDRLFHKLKGKVSLKAFSILYHESKKVHLLDNAPNPCVCKLRKSHGLPCVHEMSKYSNSGIPISIIHNYWRTLDMEIKVKEESFDDESLVHDEINELFDHVKGEGLEAKKRFVEKLKEVVFPYDVELNEPPIKRRRGRSKKDSTIRDPSSWEYIDKKYQVEQGRGRPPKVAGRGPQNNISEQGNNSFDSHQGQGNESMETKVPSGKSFPYFNQITRFIGPFIVDWHSVKGDGNCGYRSIAREIYGTEEAWLHVRIDLCEEIKSRFELYKQACVLDIPDDVQHLLESVQYFQSEDAPLDKWMSGGAIGLVVATCYQRPFVIFSSLNYSYTFLPLVATTETPVSVPRVDPEIVIGYLHESNHYIWMKMHSRCLLPPIHRLWVYFRDDGVAHFTNALSSRLAHYQSLTPHMPSQNVTLDE